MNKVYAGYPEQTAIGATALGQSTLSPNVLAHQIVDYLGANFGYGTVIIILVAGAVVVGKKKFLKLIKGGSEDGK